MSEDLFEFFKKGEYKADIPQNDSELDMTMAAMSGDYNPVNMLRDVIETIRQTEAPDGEAGEFGQIDPALEIMYELAHKFSQDVIEDMINALFEYYLDDEEDEDEPWIDNWEESLEEIDDTEKSVLMDLIRDFDLLDEAVNAVQKKRLRYLKKKRRGQLGKRGNSQAFKRNYHFDNKKKKFVKRNKAISVSAMRKKARIFKKTMRKGSSKAKNKRMKKRLSHVRNPYGK